MPVRLFGAAGFLMLRVVCWKWNNQGPKRRRVKYTAKHVNIFANMVRRNLSMPHEIVCITDDPEGIDPSIRIVPIWDDGLLAKGACYVRLKAFSREMKDIIGHRFVSIDLDCVITGPLDPLFDHDYDFVMWRNVGRGCRYCGSMFLMDAGARSEVWERFDPGDLVNDSGRVDNSHPGGRWVHPESIKAGNIIGSDQAWISSVLGDSELMWTAADGVLSYKADCGGGRRPKLKPRQQKPLPDHAKIVFFHGVEDPSQPEIQKRTPWIEGYWK